MSEEDILKNDVKKPVAPKNLQILSRNSNSTPINFEVAFRQHLAFLTSNSNTAPIFFVSQCYCYYRLACSSGLNILALHQSPEFEFDHGQG